MAERESPELATTPAWRAEMRAARLAKDLNQRQLAKKVGISQNVISGIERGTVTSSSAVLRICAVLGINPPVIAESDGVERWIEIGRQMLKDDPIAFEQQLTLLERIVGTGKNRGSSK